MDIPGGVLSQVLLKTPGMQDLVEALASYTQRHYVRLDRLVRSTFLLDYTLASMNVLMPAVGPDDLNGNEQGQIAAAGMDIDVDASTGTDVDTDAFMPPVADIQADAEIHAVLAEQHQPQQLQEMAETAESAGQQAEHVEEVQVGVQALQDERQQSQLQPQAPTKSKAGQVTTAKRCKSEPQLRLRDAAAPKAGSQTTFKAKRKKIT